MFPADEQPFLEAILTDPFADGPRLVYADYLDETGQLIDARRAELIRTQVALDRLPRHHPRRAELVNRELELVELHVPQWIAPLGHLGARFQFRRGIPDAIAIDAAAFLARGEELFDNTQSRSGQSFIRRVKLHDPARVLPDLFGSPLLAQVQELDLSWCDLGNGGATLLAHCPYLTEITHLNLGNNRIDDAGMIALARGANLPRLQSLEASDNEIGARGASALAESPSLAGLLELDLSTNEVNETGALALVNGPATSRLRVLKLAENPLGAGARSFIQSAIFNRMAAGSGVVDLHQSQLEAASGAALAEAPALSSVDELDLRENYLSDAGIQALCRGRFDALRTLRLARNQITDAGGQALLEAAIPRLQLLDVSGNRLSRRTVELLKEASRLRGFLLEAADNGTETATALPPESAARAELETLAQRKRRISYPARPPGRD